MAEPCIRNAMIVTVDAPDTVIERGTIRVDRQLIVPLMAGLGLLALLLVACGGSQAPAPVATPSILAPTATPSEPDIHIHYLGHSAFVLQFNKGVSILTDYGQSRAYGLDSPIYDVGDFQPTIVTYSHHHPDHDRGTTFDTDHVLDGLDALTLEGISLQPVLTTEKAREDNTSEILRETRREFERLLPAIAYIGGQKNSLTRILIGCTMSLALYRILKGCGVSVKEIGHIVVEIEESRVGAYPRLLVRLAGRYIHTPVGKRRLKRMMVEHSQEHNYPGGWVATLLEGDGQTFDFGIDYTECALVKFFDQQGAGEFTRYLCLIDFVQQRALGTGFSRTTTLAEGGERCDFRWKRGQETRPAWPPTWLQGDCS